MIFCKLVCSKTVFSNFILSTKKEKRIPLNDLYNVKKRIMLVSYLLNRANRRLGKTPHASFDNAVKNLREARK